MTKVPSGENVKTRLQRVISSNERARLSEAFLRDAAAKAKTACENVFVAFFPDFEEQTLRAVLPDAQAFAQTGADLGERMLNAFQFVFAKGFDEIVMIGTDSPTFPIDYIEQAFELLETSSEIVLGRTEDGGFYLIALRAPRRELFDSVAWSSPATFEQVYRNAQNLGLHLRETPSWYDVDEPGDLVKLKEEILNNPNAQRRAPHTFEWLKSFESRL